MNRTDPKIHMPSKFKNNNKSIFTRILLKVTALFGFFSKAFLWIGILGAMIPILQLVSLEICNRLGIFPLYGFFLATFLYAVFLYGIRRSTRNEFSLPKFDFLSSIRTFRGQSTKPRKDKPQVKRSFSFPKIRRKKVNTKQIPAVLLLVKHHRIEKPELNNSLK